MSANRYQAVMYVIPEDRADREIALGFKQTLRSPRQMEIQKESGGWRPALDVLSDVVVPLLSANSDSVAVVVIDFDGYIDERRADIESRFPANDQIFVIGVKHRPEMLKPLAAELPFRGDPAFEKIGRKLAEDCMAGIDGTWTDPQLEHNLPELRRLRAAVAPFLLQ